MSLTRDPLAGSRVLSGGLAVIRRQGVQTIVRALAEQHGELDETLAGLTAEDWRRSSRCPGWTISDVVLHLSQTDELALASGQGQHASFRSPYRRTDPWAGSSR